MRFASLVLLLGYYNVISLCRLWMVHISDTTSAQANFVQSKSSLNKIKQLVKYMYHLKDKNTTFNIKILLVITVH